MVERIKPPLQTAATRLGRPAFWLGLTPKQAVLLEVPEQSSGDLTRVALEVISHEGRQYLLSPKGASGWVDDVRAADGEAVLRRRSSIPVKLIEISIEEREPIIAEYLSQTDARQSFDLSPDPALEEIQAIAGDHPLFEVIRQPEAPARRQVKNDGVPEVRLTGQRGEMPVYLAKPSGEGPWPGVVLIHDIFGMTSDLKNQADWLASEGFLAAAPDLQYWGLKTRCLFATLRQMSAREGSVFDDVSTVQTWLADRDDCTGKIGVMGFCLGGGFAILISSGFGYQATSVNYGSVPEDAMSLLAGACPIVGSFGGKDEGLSEAPVLLEDVLSAHGIDHDIKVYPDAGHSFLNDHDWADMPVWAMVMGARPNETSYHDESAIDARRRIAAFFDKHLA